MLISIFQVYIADNKDFLFSFEEVNCLSQSLCCLAAFQLSDLHLFHSGSQVKLAALPGSTPAVGHHLLAKIQDAQGLCRTRCQDGGVGLPAAFMQILVHKVLVLPFLVCSHTSSGCFNI